MKAERLKPVQVMTMIVGSILSVDILMVQRQMVLIANQDAWLALFLGGVLTLVVGLLVYKLVAMHPTADLPQIYLNVGGEFFGRVLLIPNMIYGVLYTGFSLRIFAQALKTFLLNKTPTYAIVVLMIIVVAYAVYNGIYTIGGLIDILFPMCLLTVIILSLLSLQQINPIYIKPILYDNTKGVLKGIIPGERMFTGYGLFAYLYCHVDKPDKTLKWYLIGIMIPIFLYVTLTVLSIMAFNTDSIVSLVYPTLTLSKSIEFPTTFLERLEAFIAVLWIGIVFMSLVMFYYSVCRDLIVFLKMGKKAERVLPFALIPLITFISLMIGLELTVIDIFDKIKVLHTISIPIIIPIAIILTVIKRKRSNAK